MTFATDSSGPPWSVDWNPDNGTYSLDAVATDNLGGIGTSAARTHTASVSPPAGTTLTTLTIHNNSTTAQPSDFITKSFGHDFKQADIPAGDYPQFQLHDTTPVPFTMWGETEWSADGSFDFAGFVLRVPVGVPAKRTFTSSGSVLSAASHTGLTNGDPVRFITTNTLPTGMSPASTYYIRLGAGVAFTIHPTRADAIANTGAIATSGAGSGTHNMLPGVEVLVKNGGTAPASSALTNSDITSNSDLKVVGDGARNITGTNTSAVNSGIAAGNVFVIASGPVGRVLRVRAPFNDGTTDNAQAGMWHYLFQLQNSSGGRYGLRWLAGGYNGFVDSTGTFLQKVFLGLDVKDGGTTIRSMAPKATVKTLTAQPSGLLTLNNITELPGYGGTAAVRITTTGTLPAGLSSSVSYFVNVWNARYTLAFDAKSGSFTAGQVVTQGTSGATATIVGVEDNGATGTLYLRAPSGTFADNLPLTDPLGGAATANGTLATATNAISLYTTGQGGQSGTTGEVLVTSAGTGTHSLTVVPRLDCYASGPFTAGATAEYDFVAAGGTGAETTCDVIVNRAYRISTKIYGPRRETALPSPLPLRSYAFEAWQDYLYSLDSAGERKDLGYLPGYGMTHFHRQTPDDLQTIRVHGLQMGLQAWSLRRSDTNNIINMTGSTHTNLGAAIPTFYLRWGATAPKQSGIKAPDDYARLWGAYDYSHQPFPHVYAYVITAEPQYLAMMFDTAVGGAGTLTSDKQITINSVQYNGVLWKGAIQSREFGWTLNGMGWARRFSPAAGWNGADMRAYFEEIIDQNVASFAAEKTHNASTFCRDNGFYPKNTRLIQPWQESYTVTAMCAIYGHYPSVGLAAHIADTVKNWNAMRVNMSLYASTSFSMYAAVVTNALTSWTQVFASQGPGSITWVASTDTITYTGGGDDRGTPANDDMLMFSSTAVSTPAGLSNDTVYYMVNVDNGPKTFQLAATAGGAALNITADGSISDSSRYGGKMASASNSNLDGFDSANSTRWKAYAASRWANALGVSMPSGFLTAYDAVLGSGGSDPPPTTSFQNDTNVYDLAETF